MEKQRTTKVVALSALIVAIVSITVAFAAMSTTLTINGTALMQTALWDVRFDGTLNPQTIGDASITTMPTLTDTTMGTFAVVLTRPGDGIRVRWDIRNDGTIDARIGSILQNGVSVTSVGPANIVCTGLNPDPVAAAADAAIVCNNLVYTLTYVSGGAPVSVNDLLPPQSWGREIELFLSFGGNQLPADDVQISGLGISLVYVQD